MTDLRRTMARSDLESLPLYPEGRACQRPKARRVIDLFEEAQLHEPTRTDLAPLTFATDLTRVRQHLPRPPQYRRRTTDSDVR